MKKKATVAARRKKQWKEDAEEIGELCRRIKTESPRRGWHPEESKVEKFSSLPISERTLRGLEAGKFEDMKPIQYATIPHALAGRDILGAARTGSGKTLAFLVPLLEKLYRERWSPDDGLGALVLSPTRELAMQIFQVLRQVGSYHDLSAGLVTGGSKDFSGEKARIGRMCVLAATPGRVLQHLQESPNFDASRTCVLVVDEADRVVDLGFAPQLRSVVEYLPRGASGRQTLLFSATLAGSASVVSSKRDLLNVSPKIAQLRQLCDKETVEFVVARTDRQALTTTTTTTTNDDEDSTTPTPRKLRQCYVVCELHEKLDVVYSFIKSHLRCKSIVFVSACAQARYILEALRGMQPGVPLLALHGKMSQKTRTAVYYDFAEKPHAVLFATDVAARGLDFPKVDWVVQLDAPEDADAYVHRAGRAARNEKSGDAMLVLLPSEEPKFSRVLKKAKIPINKVAVNPAKRRLSTGGHVTALVASRPEVKALAQTAFKSYVRSIVLATDKETFKIHDLKLDLYASSLGLAAPPALKLPNPEKAEAVREATHARKNVNRKLDKLKAQIKAAKAAKRNGPDAEVSSKTKSLATIEEDDEPPLLVSAKNKRYIEEVPTDVAAGHVTKKPKKLKIRRDGQDDDGENKKTRFDDRGQPIVSEQTMPRIDEKPAAGRTLESLQSSHEDFVARVKSRLRDSDAADREAQRQARRKKMLKKKQQRREEDEGENAAVAVLASSNDSEDE